MVYLSFSFLLQAVVDKYGRSNVMRNREHRKICRKGIDYLMLNHCLLSLPNKVWETYCFCSVSYYYYYYYYYSCSCFCPFFPCTMNLSTADLRNFRTEFHETWWSYRYMFLVNPKVFRFVVKGVKAIFLGVQRGWGLL